MSSSSNPIEENYAKVVDQIRHAAGLVHRDPDQIRLVVVTKNHPVEHIALAVQAGIKLFGENYVEEALSKISAFQPSENIEWHMIGHVQSRKARLVCEHFDLLHSLDSLKLANRLDRSGAELNKKLPVLLECNVSGEESKNGFPAWDEANWPNLCMELEQIAALGNIEIVGLMTMAPFFDAPELARPSFRKLRELRDYLSPKISCATWDLLSMGMSGDFEAAVQEGATILRIGTAIMGSRN